MSSTSRALLFSKNGLEKITGKKRHDVINVIRASKLFGGLENEKNMQMGKSEKNSQRGNEGEA